MTPEEWKGLKAGDKLKLTDKGPRLVVVENDDMHVYLRWVAEGPGAHPARLEHPIVDRGWSKAE